MARERRRAALAALCVLAVAVAATLFPASGFGGQPAGVGVGGDGGAGAPAGGASGSDSADSTADRPPADETETTTATETTTTTTTQTTTTTATPSTAGDSGPGGGDLLAEVVLVAFGLAALVGGVGFWTGALAVTSAAGLLPFTLVVGGTPVGELVGRLPTRTMALVVGLSSWVPRLLDDATALTRAVGGSLGSVFGALGRASADALRVGASGLAATVAALPRALAGLSAGASVFASLGDVGVPSLGGRSGGDDRGGRSGGPRPDDGPEETAPPSVEEAWEAMRDRVTDRRARTPGEVARAAIRRGYPDEAVRRLTDAFREVRYGDLPRDARTESARSALDRLRDHWRGEE